MNVLEKILASRAYAWAHLLYVLFFPVYLILFFFGAIFGVVSIVFALIHSIFEKSNFVSGIKNTEIYKAHIVHFSELELSLFFSCIALSFYAAVLRHQLKRSVSRKSNNRRFAQTLGSAIEQYIDFHTASQEQITASIQLLMDAIAEHYTDCCKASCHASLKICDPVDRDIAYTYFRSSGRSYQMECSDRWSAVEEDKNEPIKAIFISKNTAFKSISSGGRENFISNYLRLRRFCWAYQNTSKDWQKFYRSTVIVKIRIKRGSSGVLSGFLCVDSMKAKFSKRDLRNLEGFSEIVGMVLGRVPRVQSHREDELASVSYLNALGENHA